MCMVNSMTLFTDTNCVVLLFLQGTNIASGKCRGIVVLTGLKTEIGSSSSHNYNTLT